MAEEEFEVPWDTVMLDPALPEAAALEELRATMWGLIAKRHGLNSDMIVTYEVTATEFKWTIDRALGGP